MRRILGSWAVLAALPLVLGTSVATRHAAAQPATEPGERQIESRIVNVNGEMIQLDDGTVVRVPHGLALQADLREGKRVKIRHEVKDGKAVAKSIEVRPEPSRSKP